MTAISFDGKTDVKKAVEILKGKIALVGYVDTMGTLLHGSPEEVYQSSVDCIRAGVDILCAGCAWPAHIPTENILAMIRAANDNYKLRDISC
jgi:uroporphyrinogen-III decarboxylase